MQFGNELKTEKEISDAFRLRIRARRQHLQTKKQVNVDIRPQAKKNLVELKKRLRTHQGLRPEMKERIELEKRVSFPDKSPDEMVLTDRERRLIAKLASLPFVLAHGSHYMTEIKKSNALQSVKQRERRGIKPVSHTQSDTGNDDTVFFAYKEVPHYVRANDQIAVNLSEIIEKEPIKAQQFWSSDVFFCHKFSTTLPPVQLGHTTLQIKYRNNAGKYEKIFEYQLQNGEIDTEVFARGEEVSFGANIPVYRFYRIIEQLRKMDSNYREYILNNINNEGIIDAMVRALTLVRGYELHRTAEQSLNDKSVSINTANKVDAVHTEYTLAYKIYDGKEEISITSGTTLIKAVLEGNLSEVKALLKAGADINHRTAYGLHEVSPLYAAVLSNRTEMVEFLLEHAKSTCKNKVYYPANPFVSPPKTQKPLEISLYHENAEITSLLLQSGAYHIEKTLPDSVIKGSSTALKLLVLYYNDKLNPDFSSNKFGMFLKTLRKYYISQNPTDLECLYATILIYKYKLTEPQDNILKIMNSLDYLKRVNNIGTQLLLDYINILDNLLINLNSDSATETVFSRIFDLAIKQLEHYNDSGPLKALLNVIENRVKRKSDVNLFQSCVVNYFQKLTKPNNILRKIANDYSLTASFNFLPTDIILKNINASSDTVSRQNLKSLIIKAIHSNDDKLLGSYLSISSSGLKENEITHILCDVLCSLPNEKLEFLRNKADNSHNTLPESAKKQIYFAAKKRLPHLRKLSGISGEELSSVVDTSFRSAMYQFLLTGNHSGLTQLLQLYKDKGQQEEVKNIIRKHCIASYKASYPNVDIEKQLFQDYSLALQYHFILGETPNLIFNRPKDPSALSYKEIKAHLHCAIYNKDMSSVKYCILQIEKLPEQNKKKLYDQTFYSLSPEASFELFKMGFSFSSQDFSFELKEYVLSQACEHITKNNLTVEPGLFEILSNRLLLSFQEKMFDKLPAGQKEKLSKGAKLLKLKKQLNTFLDDEKEILNVINQLTKQYKEMDLFLIINNEKYRESQFIHDLHKRCLGWTPVQIEFFNRLIRTVKNIDSTQLKTKDIDEIKRVSEIFKLNPDQAYDYYQISKQKENHHEIMFQLQPSARTYLNTYSNLSIALSVIFLNIFLLVLVPIVFNVAIANEKKKVEGMKDSPKTGINPYLHDNLKADPAASVGKDIAKEIVHDVVTQQQKSPTLTFVPEKVVDHPLILGF